MPHPKMSPAPNWTSIFTLRDDLTPPGYTEILIDMLENPRVKPSDIKQQETKKKKKEKSLGRGQTR